MQMKWPNSLNYKLPKLNQDETDNLNSPIIKEIKFEK